MGLARQGSAGKLQRADPNRLRKSQRSPIPAAKEEDLKNVYSTRPVTAKPNTFDLERVSQQLNNSFVEKPRTAAGIKKIPDSQRASTSFHKRSRSGDLGIRSKTEAEVESAMNLETFKTVIKALE